MCKLAFSGLLQGISTAFTSLKSINMSKLCLQELVCRPVGPTFVTAR